MAAIVLAGGRSTRLGQDKAFVTLDGMTLLEAVLRVLQQVESGIILVTNEPEKYRSFAAVGMTVTRDEVPHQGPLGGILAGLAATSDPLNVVVPCDAPLIRPALLKYLLEAAEDHDAVVPTVDGRPEPLVAAYTNRCIEPMRRHLAAGERRVVSFFDELNVYYVPSDILDVYDRERLSFFNVNTKEDLAEARRRFQSGLS